MMHPPSPQEESFEREDLVLKKWVWVKLNVPPKYFPVGMFCDVVIVCFPFDFEFFERRHFIYHCDLSTHPQTGQEGVAT